MTLKDIINTDLRIFVNTNELAEAHSINNVSVNCIICDNVITNKNAMNFYEKDLGIKTSDLSSIPGNFSVESIINIDGISYKIKNISDCEGFSTIQLTSAIENLGLTHTVKYRNKYGTGGDQDLGIPGIKTAWNQASTLDYSYFDIISQNMEVNNFGILTQGDVQIKLKNGQNLGANYEDLEFQINDETYNLINNKVVVDAYWTTLFLRLV